ncbi:hypothetical protein RIF29_20473 [Crotalaria pallida]|uniref:Carbonic anhydrase n=1 Tax=Crotalaria pallida TaxID=3830 RepID=A0AAN9F197_CROPI
MLTVFLPYFLILVTIFLHLSIWTTAQEAKQEREFDYIKGSEKGPSHWGDLKKEWATCKNGKMQSPIDLSSLKVIVNPELGKLKNYYKPQNATIVNEGHDIALKWKGDAGSIFINGTEFFLQQCHWHSPSEHTINGRRYDLELHVVHHSLNPNAKSKLAVVGVLFRIDRPDSTLSKLTKYIKSMMDEEAEKSIGLIDPSKIKLGGKKYYRYMGSRTTPPCTEGVIWSIKTKIRRVSKEQVKLLKEAVYDYAKKNARPIQPLNQRGIQLYI